MVCRMARFGFVLQGSSPLSESTYWQAPGSATIVRFADHVGSGSHAEITMPTAVLSSEILAQQLGELFLALGSRRGELDELRSSLHAALRNKEKTYHIEADLGPAKKKVAVVWGNIKQFAHDNR